MTPPRRPTTQRPTTQRPTTQRSTTQRPAGTRPQAPRAAGPRASVPRAAGPRRPAPRPARPLGRPGVRLRSGFAVVLAVLLLLGGRLLQLQGLQATAYADEAASQRLRTVVLAAPRGEVLDRAGDPLAMSVEARAVFAEPRTIAKAVCPAVRTATTTPCDAPSIAAAVAPVLRLPVAQVLAKLTQTNAFAYLARGLDPAVAAKVQALDLPGVGVLSEPRRVHPGGQLAAGVLGFTDVDGKGAQGVESAWQSVLAGTDGTTRGLFDHGGRSIPTDGSRTTAPVAGRSLQLTLDRDLQWYAQKVLAAEVKATQAKNGTVVVMDVRTGQVLALATAPTFDPDHRQGVDQALLGNPAVSEVYEPGSVNKVISAAAALQAGVVTPDSVITVPPTYKVGSHTVHDAERHGTEHLTFTGVLAKSSNIGTVEVAQKVGPQRLYDMLRGFGFGTKSGLGLPGESRGVIPRPARWSGTSIATIPIGQGISVNAVQVASVYATIANGGVRVTPNIVLGERDASGHLTPAPAPSARRVVSQVVADQVRAMLESVVSEQGTAPKAAVAGYRVAGKTGTAQRVVGGRYNGSYTSSFIGFAPADAPRFVTAVVLQGTGSKGYFGGQVAAPVFSSVMGFALRGAGVAPTGTTPPVLRLTAADPVTPAAAAAADVAAIRPRPSAAR